MVGILCVFYSEFDNRMGPQIVYQYPENFITEDTFDSFSDYVIPKPELCGKLITIKACGWSIMGYPVLLQDKKYPRSKLMWNVGFVFDETFDVIAFEPIVKKLGCILQTFEKESEFLFRSETKARMANIIIHIMKSLNRPPYECHVWVNEANTINLKLFPRIEAPPEIMLHEVPVRIRDLDLLLRRDWDMTLQQIIPHVNGINHVKAISSLANVDIDLVKCALRHLYYYDCIRMIDAFQYSNMYAICTGITELSYNIAMQYACVEYVCQKNNADGSRSVSFSTIFTLYMSFRPGIRVADFCTRHNLMALGIDERRLVTFGVLNKILRRIHHYPINLGPSSVGVESSGPLRLTKLMVGSRNYDEICCEVGCSSADVDAAAKAMKSCVVVSK